MFHHMGKTYLRYSVENLLTNMRTVNHMENGETSKKNHVLDNLLKHNGESTMLTYTCTEFFLLNHVHLYNAHYIENILLGTNRQIFSSPAFICTNI